MIYIPKICGTCKGAMNAINTAYEANDKQKNKKSKKNVYILKEILHNKEVIQNLHTKGIDCVDNLDNLDEKDIVIIRGHGEPKSVYENIHNKKIEYYDATCSNVKKIHELVDQKSKENYIIIIVGKKNHPEVIGTLGWTNNNGLVVENEEDINKIESNDKHILVVAQTTFSKEKFSNLSTIIKSKFKNVTVLNTICGAQKAIQNSSTKIAKEMNIMFVIGGENSSNTEELYQLCLKECESYKFSDINEFFKFNIKNSSISNNIKIGITGGASTPRSEIIKYKNLLEFIIFYKEMKTLFEKNIVTINNSFKYSKDNKIIRDVTNKLIDINNGGKYIRATLIALGYKMGSENFDNNFLNLALAYETFQTSVLVHDDIIDNATLRRGKETIPFRYEKEFCIDNKNSSFLNNKTHISNSIGICSGDLGFYLANKIIIDTYKDNKNFTKVFSYYNDIVINTIKGEIIDVVLPFKEKYNLSQTKEEDIMQIYHLKTSWYTIIGPFVLGLLLSGYDKNIKKIENILNNIGIAFQIKDDIIGIFNDSGEIGKSNQSDINEYKQTLLYSYTIKNKKYKDMLLKYYGKENLKEKELKQVKNIFVDSGALKYSTDKMNELFEISESEINKANFIKEDIKNILLGLITYLRIRNK